MLQIAGRGVNLVGWWGLDPLKMCRSRSMFCPPPCKCHILSFKTLDNSASFTSSRIKDLCQKWKVKPIFRGTYGLSGTGIVECLEITDVGCNLKQFDCLTWLTLVPLPIFYDRSTSLLADPCPLSRSSRRRIMQHVCSRLLSSRCWSNRLPGQTFPVVLSCIQRRLRQWFIQTPRGVITPQFSCDTPNHLKFKGGYQGCLWGVFMWSWWKG